jgi:hypothetical protein
LSFHTTWTREGFVPALNPVSPVYGGRMVDPARIHVYCWDARPFPAFPNRISLWGYGANWHTGHWLNGRTAAVSLPALVSALLEQYGFQDYDVGGISGSVTGFVIDRIMSAREALQPLELAHFFDAVESDGVIAFRRRGHSPPVLTLDVPRLVEDQVGSELYRLTRGQETDLPVAAKVNFISSVGGYERAVAEARRQATISARVSSADLPIVMEPEQAGAVAETWLYESWIARDRLRLSLPPSALAIEPGDLVSLETGARGVTARVVEIADRGARRIEALAMDSGIYGPVAAPMRLEPDDALPSSGAPLVHFLDVPPSGDAPQAGLLAVAQEPWPGTVAVYRSSESAAFRVHALISKPATVGLTASVLEPGPFWRLDHVNSVDVDLDRGSLRSVSRLQVLGGANSIAIETAPDDWEVLQFETATLVGPSRYRLSGLLRGQRGTERFTGGPVPAGARFVVLDDAITAVDMSRDDVGLPFNWRVGPVTRDIGDRRYAAYTHAFQAVGLAPLAPVHITASRDIAGELTLSWTRRTRVSGDGWDVIEVPLGEERELYDVEILNGTSVVRTLAVETSRVIVTAAMQLEDFGVLPPTLEVRIFQVAPGFGRGRSRVAAV